MGTKVRARSYKRPVRRNEYTGLYGIPKRVKNEISRDDELRKIKMFMDEYYKFLEEYVDE